MKRDRLTRQDKGFAEELRQFLAVVRGEQPPPIGLEALRATSDVTFKRGQASNDAR